MEGLVPADLLVKPSEVQGGRFGIAPGLRAVPSFVSELEEIGCLSFGVTLGGVSGKL